MIWETVFYKDTYYLTLIFYHYRFNYKGSVYLSIREARVASLVLRVRTGPQCPEDNLRELM